MLKHPLPAPVSLYASDAVRTCALRSITLALPWLVQAGIPGKTLTFLSGMTPPKSKRVEENDPKTSLQKSLP